MSRTVRVNATLDEELLRRIDDFAASRHEDRSTAIRQLADLALREMVKRDAVDAYRQGRVTLRDFAGILGVGTWAAHDLLTAEGVAIAQGDRAETAGAVDALSRGPRGWPRE